MCAYKYIHMASPDPCTHIPGHLYGNKSPPPLHANEQMCFHSPMTQTHADKLSGLISDKAGEQIGVKF